jgi:signal transduction histidine kinase
VLTCGTRFAGTIDDEDVAVLELVATGVAAALERWDLVAELSRRAADLKEADERKDHFLAMLGHELRNPLAPVMNAVTLMRSHDYGDPLLERVVEAANRQIQHMTRLLDDLLDVSRIRTGKIELKSSRIDLRDVMRDAVAATESAAVSSAGRPSGWRCRTAPRRSRGTPSGSRRSSRTCSTTPSSTPAARATSTRPCRATPARS